MVQKKSLDVDFDLSSASINAPQKIAKSAPVFTKTDSEVIKRLTLDMPSSLHKKLKIMAMDQDTTMANMIRGWLEDKTK
jgi:hypothetical protein